MNARDLKEGDVVWYFDKMCLPKCGIVRKFLRKEEVGDYEVVEFESCEKTEIVCNFFLYRSEDDVKAAVRSQIYFLEFWLKD